MTAEENQAPAHPFYLDVDGGRRFCLYHAPHHNRECAGTVLYVHPFGDEMNSARRMAALQSRAFSAMGFGVLQIDLFGCGDSDGELRDVNWALWKQDLAAAAKWLRKQAGTELLLWGLRLGATLAIDFARSSKEAIDCLILWQPVINGQAYMNQFLRIQLAGNMLAQNGNGTATMQNPRKSLAAGEVVEAGGYELTPALAEAIGNVNLTNLSGLHMPIHWFEISERVTAERAAVLNAWIGNGIDAHLRQVHCSSFWSSPEIRESPQLLSATSAILPKRLYEC